MGVWGHETREIYVGNVGYLKEEINMSDLRSGGQDERRTNLLDEYMTRLFESRAWNDTAVVLMSKSRLDWMCQIGGLLLHGGGN